MKKTLLFISLIISLGGISQNIKDQQISFGYIQLPSEPLNKSIKTYSLVIDNSAFQKSNEDSLAAYDMRLSSYTTNYEAWLVEKKKIDKAYLMEMAKWERLVNAGNATAPMPVKPPYPEQPVKEEIMLPILTEDVAENSLSSFQYEGYDKGEGGVVITISPMGFMNAKIDVKKTGAGLETKYTYTSTCKYPIKVKMEVPGQGVVLEEVMFDSPKVEGLKTYDNKYEHEIWLLDNYDTYWANKQKSMLASEISAISSTINERFGFPQKIRGTEIYTVKKHKGHNYSDLIDAYSNAKAGYDLLSQGTDKTKAKVKLDKAISIWEKALKESDLNNNKARINDKITGIIYANLAEAYMWKDDFLNADNYAQKALLSGVMKAKSAAKRLQPMIGALKDRYQANQ